MKELISQRFVRFDPRLRRKRRVGRLGDGGGRSVGGGGPRVVPVQCMHGRERAHVYVTPSENGKRKRGSLGPAQRCTSSPGGPLLHFSRAQREIERRGNKQEEQVEPK